MIKFIREVVSRLSGKSTVHAKCADIKGRKSGGSRDSNGQDWYAKSSEGSSRATEVKA
jgi:hypothetical protein